MMSLWNPISLPACGRTVDSGELTSDPRRISPVPSVVGVQMGSNGNGFGDCELGVS